MKIGVCSKINCAKKNVKGVNGNHKLCHGVYAIIDARGRIPPVKRNVKFFVSIKKLKDSLFQEKAAGERMPIRGIGMLA